MIKFFKYLFLDIFIVLVILELLLRFYGFIYKFQISHLYKNKQSAYKIKILAVGESTTDGLWIENKSYPLQLQSKLKVYYNCKDCISMNILSIPGANTSNILYHYQKELLKSKPDIVIFMTGVNDKYFYSYNIDALISEKLFPNKVFYQIYVRLISVLNEMRIFRLIKFVCVSKFMPQETYLDLTETFRKEVSQNRIDFGSYHDPFLLAQTKKNITELVQITKTNNIVPILMTYHSAYQINNIIREVAAENGALLIDNEPLFNKNNWEKLILKKDNWHPNEQGYAVIADNVFKHLIKYKIIKK